MKYFVEPPVGLRERKVFIDEATVSLSPPALHPNGVIRWTTDGARPSASSLVLRGAVRISAPMRVSAALFLPDGRTSGTITGDYVKEAPRPSLEAGPAAAQKGATCTYYEGDFHRLPDVTKLVPRARFNAPGLDLPQLEEALGKTMRKERFALACEAIARVPADGVYRFIASADDGVRLDVDGVRVLEDDGEHAPRAVDGEIALAAGGHRIRLLYFQGTQGKALELRLEGGPLASAPLPLQR